MVAGVLRSPFAHVTRSFLLLTIALLLGLSGANPYNCDVYVSHGGSDSSTCGSTLGSACATIERGVWNARRGDVVCALAGPIPYLCPEDGEVRINKPLVLASYNGTTVIDCEGRGRAFSFVGVASAVLSRFEMRNGNMGYTGSGGAIYTNTTTDLHIEHCTFVNNSVNPLYLDGTGGAISSFNDADLCIENCTFIDNTAPENGGGAISCFNGTDLRIENCTYINNSGGAVSSFSDTGLRIENCTFVNNTVTGTGVTPGGGAVYSLSDTNIRVQGCTFANNAAAGTGTGGAVLFFGGINLHIDSCTFVDNTIAGTGAGGAVYLFGDTDVHIHNCTFVNNTVAGYGGAVGSSGNTNIRIQKCTCSGNKAAGAGGEGGAIYSQDDAGLRIENCTFANNTATFMGGAAAVVMERPFSNNTVVLERNIIRGNSATFGSNNRLVGGGKCHAQHPTLHRRVVRG